MDTIPQDHAVSAYFEAQARWRDDKADQYPDDQRNANSALALFKLSEWWKDVEHDESQDPGWSAGQVAFLRRNIDDGGSLGGEETQRTVSRFGFGAHVFTDASFEQFIAEVCGAVALDAFKAVQDFASDGARPAAQAFGEESGLAADDVEAALAGEYRSPTHFANRYGNPPAT